MASEPLCDTHVHVVGDPARYPLDAARTYKPGLAPLARLESAAGPLGIGRFVIVQPSFYGTDNSLLLDSLVTLAGRGRGVAVIDPDRIAPAELDAMAAKGIRGLRINLYSGSAERPGEALAEAFGRQAAVAVERGWHVEVIATLPVLAEAADVLRCSPVPVVIDHYGLHGDAGPAAPDGRALLDLVGLTHVWMKLSAPYRAAGELEIRPNAPWLAAFMAAAPDRCVWGSDWPHTPAHRTTPDAHEELPYRDIDYGALLAAFRQALPDGETADRVLRHNPARLYGFSS